MNCQNGLANEARLKKMFNCPLLQYELGPQGSKFQDRNGDLYFVVERDNHLWYVKDKTCSGSRLVTGGKGRR